jgi:hypothetical protein
MLIARHAAVIVENVSHDREVYPESGAVLTRAHPLDARDKFRDRVAEALHNGCSRPRSTQWAPSNAHVDHKG